MYVEAFYIEKQFNDHDYDVDDDDDNTLVRIYCVLHMTDHHLNYVLQEPFKGRRSVKDMGYYLF